MRVSLSETLITCSIGSVKAEVQAANSPQPTVPRRRARTLENLTQLFGGFTLEKSPLDESVVRYNLACWA